MDNVSGLPNRGFTYHGGTPDDIGKSIGIEGHPMKFRDEIRTSGGLMIKRSNRFTHAILVRNTSGAALLPGRSVVWEAGYRGRRVNGYSATTAVEVAGVVDDRLPAAGVADDDLFWLLRKGPALIKSPLAAGAGSVFAEGNVLVALTAVTSGATTAGRPAVLDTALTTNTGLALVNNFARVMSAMTTAQTNQDMLVDLQLND